MRRRADAFRVFCVAIATSLILLACGDQTESLLPTTSQSVDTSSTQVTETESSSSFVLSSSAFSDGGVLPIEFTCDGSSSSPPLSWTNGPVGTVGYAVAMHHIPGPGDSHWYWVAYGIDLTKTEIVANDSSIASLGTNSVNGKNEYSPPCSKGPGEKTYTFTVFALSQQPEFAVGSDVSRDVLLAAIEKNILATATLDVTYDRTGVPGVEAAPTPPANEEVKG